MMLTHSPTGDDVISQLLAAWVESVLHYDEIMAGDKGATAAGGITSAQTSVF